MKPSTMSQGPARRRRRTPRARPPSGPPCRPAAARPARPAPTTTTSPAPGKGRLIGHVGQVEGSVASMDTWTAPPPPLRNAPQLITYVDRLAGDLVGLSGGHARPVWRGVRRHAPAAVLPADRWIDAGFDPIDCHLQVDPRLAAEVMLRTSRSWPISSSTMSPRIRTVPGLAREGRGLGVPRHVPHQGHDLLRCHRRELAAIDIGRGPGRRSRPMRSPVCPPRSGPPSRPSRSTSTSTTRLAGPIS